MSLTSPNWFNEKFKDKITIDLQAFGGYLDGTMMEGDVQAGTVKFAVVGGTSSVYKLTGAIEPVPVNDIGLSTVSLTFEDFEASEWWRTQDAWKAGAREQDALKMLMVMAIRRKRDGIKFDAVKAFYDANTGTVTSFGTDATVPNPYLFETARADLNKYGDLGVDDEVFCPVPELVMSQLEVHELYGKTEWGAGVSEVFNKTQRTKMRKVRGINFIVCPDSYFREPGTTGWETFMWRKSALGAETPVNQESPGIYPQTQMQGTPWLAKAAISGAAVGILTKGVKRILLDKITAVTAPS
jgi:hypothetical protein